MSGRRGFSMPLKLQYEWIDPAGAKGRELRATWARLEIEIDGHVVTRAIDDVSRSVRDSVYLPLYPLAEWLVTNWWFLLYEVEPRRFGAGDGYYGRHSLRSAGEGFALPALLFSPTGSTIQALWRPADLEHQRLEFTERGHATIDAQEFRETVLRFARSVVARLRDLDVRDTLLETELTAVETTGQDEESFCAATAALGLDPYSLDDSTAQEVVATADALPGTVVDEFFVIADVPRLREQRSAILGSIDSIRSNRAELSQLRDLRSDINGIERVGKPWRHGYNVARALRGRLGVEDVHIDSLHTLAQALRVDRSQLTTAVMPILAEGEGFDAIVDANSAASPTFAVVQRNEPATLFALCRAMFEYFVTSSDGPRIVTRSRTDRQKRNRAFAAEFLVPAEQLRSLIPQPVITSETVDDLADHFGASSAVIRHQIDNHRLATVAD
jgi:hypothetical protein